jgi:hypothetical protein
MHKMIRDKVRVVDGVNVLMWCEACDDFVKFYSSDRKVRCANALRAHYRKEKKEVRQVDTVDELVDVGEVMSTLDYVRKCEDEQDGHCNLCGSYVRKPRSDARPRLHLVAVGQNAYVPGLYCWDCRTFMVSKLRGDLDAKADRLLIAPPVSPSDA